MTKFTLICDQSCDLDTHIVNHTFTGGTLDDVLPNIEEFLRGAGYYFDGYLTIAEIPTIEEITVETPQHNEHFYDTERNR
jgi:hypothetical protein